MSWLLAASARTTSTVTASRIVQAATATASASATALRQAPLLRSSRSSHNSHSFSSARPPVLRRPPSKKEEPGQSDRRKWRTHAVSLALGDYSDDYVMPDTLSDPTTNEYNWEDDEMDLSEEVREVQEEIDQQKQRWLQTAKPPVRVPEIDERGRAYGRGGRKTAAARVWIQPGLGHVVVNQKDFVEYFERTTDRELVLAPLAATATCGKFDVTAMVTGGGLTGQAGAIRHGLARALNHFNPDTYRPPLKRLGYLTRDPRKVERKKVGHLKARKKPQWVKR